MDLSNIDFKNYMPEKTLHGYTYDQIQDNYEIKISNLKKNDFIQSYFLDYAFSESAMFNSDYVNYLYRLVDFNYVSKERIWRCIFGLIGSINFNNRFKKLRVKFSEDTMINIMRFIKRLDGAVFNTGEDRIKTLLLEYYRNVEQIKKKISILSSSSNYDFKNSIDQSFHQTLLENLLETLDQELYNNLFYGK
jgi:hypothetical protein